MHYPPGYYYYPIPIKRKINKSARIVLLTLGFILLLIGLWLLIGGLIWSVRVGGEEDFIHGSAAFGALCLPIGGMLSAIGLFLLIVYFNNIKEYPATSLTQLKSEFLIFGIIILIIFTPIYSIISIDNWENLLYGKELFEFDDLYLSSIYLMLGIFITPLIIGSMAICFNFKKLYRIPLFSILIILLLVVPSYYGYDINVISKASEKTKIDYDVRITIEGDGEYILYLPLILDMDNKSLTNSIEKLKDTKGQSVPTEIINTTYGQALKIIGNKSIYFRSTCYHYFNSSSLDNHIRNLDSKNPYFKPRLSAQINHTVDQEGTDFMVFCQKDPTISKLSFRLLARFYYNYIVYTKYDDIKQVFGQGIALSLESSRTKDGWQLITE